MSAVSLPEPKGKRRRPHRYMILVVAIFFFIVLRIIPSMFQLSDVYDIVEANPKLKKSVNEDEFLSQFIANFDNFYRDANPKTPASHRQQVCETDTTNLVLEEWKQNHRKLICEAKPSVSSTTKEPQETTIYNDSSELLVDEYVLPRWEGQPKIFRYQNVEAWSMRGPVRTECRPAKSTSTELEDLKLRVTEDDNTLFDTIYVDATVIRVRLFDVNNPYEGFHAYLNVAMVMMTFDIRDPQLVLAVNEPNERDTEMWRTFSKLEPIFVSEQITEEDCIPKTRYRFREVFEAPPSHLSMINTKSKEGGLNGRWVDHECKSPLLLAFTQWIKRRLDPMNHSIDSERPIDSGGTSRPIQILWSSRQPYCCRGGKMYTPKRIIKNETQWIDSLGALLGDGYKIKVVDFGILSLFESVNVVKQSDIMVGAHGAGLMWSVFLPFGKSGEPTDSTSESKGLVEIFTGDRAHVNRHYHNIASLVGIQYRETKHWSSSDKMFRWDEKRLNEVVSQIRSIDIKWDRK